MQIGFIYTAHFSQTLHEVLGDCLPFLEKMAEVTVGASAVPGVGYWAPTHEFEWSVRVTADCPPEKVGDLMLLVTSMATAWGQEHDQQAVALIVGDEIKIITLYPVG